MYNLTTLSKSGFGQLKEGSPQRFARDADGVGNAWKTTNEVLPNLTTLLNAISKHDRDINRLRRRVPTFVQQQSAFFPFKIYQIGNQSATDAQNAAYVAVGADINNFTFQIRSGFIGYRSQYFLHVGFPATFEEPLFCICTDNIDVFDSPPVANTGLTVVLSNAADTLIYDDSSFGLNLPQIAIDPTEDDLGQIRASFWIVLIDDPDLGLYTQLWGRMFTDDVFDSTGRPTDPLPSNTDSSIVPIGTVLYNAALTGSFASLNGVVQYLSGNLSNRYAALAPLGSTLGPVSVPRGFWTADSLSGEVFYMGDVVQDDSAIYFTISGKNFYAVWTYTGASAGKIAIISSPPSASSSNWKQTGIYSV